MDWLTDEQVVQRLRERPRMAGPVLVYSTMLGGWTDSPLGLLVGLDDHGFHRGDGVFEALRFIDRKPYLLKPHWERMRASAARIDLTLPLSIDDLSRALRAGLERFPQSEGLLRLFATRGPGGFSVSPFDSIAPQFFCVLMPFKKTPEDRYQAGARIGRSRIRVKDPWLAITKSLNYLPNVMMKKEAVERQLDFTVSFDDQGGVAESSTENIALLNHHGELVHPPLSGILKGCTMTRLFDLVQERGIAPVVRDRLIGEEDLLRAQGVFMIGTTLDVLPVSEYEGRALQRSPLEQTLRSLLQEDQRRIDF